MLKSSKDIISARPMDRTHSSRKTFPGLVMVLVLPMEELRELIYLSGTAKANLEGLCKVPRMKFPLSKLVNFPRFMCPCVLIFNRVLL